MSRTGKAGRTAPGSVSTPGDVKTTVEIVCVCPPLTFKGKLVELPGQVIDHHPLAAGLPQPVHPVDKVRDHLVDGVGVRQDMFGLQHPWIQDAAYALPLGAHSARSNEKDCYSMCINMAKMTMAMCQTFKGLKSRIGSIAPHNCKPVEQLCLFAFSHLDRRNRTRSSSG